MRTQLTKLCTTALAAAALLTAGNEAQAQSADQKTNLQIYGSALQYKGDLDNQFFESHALEWGGGLNLNRYISPSFDGSLQLTYGSAEAEGTAPAKFDAQLGTAMLAVRLKMNNGKILKEDAFFGPYLQVGGGGVWAKTDATLASGAKSDVDKFLTGALKGGAGIKFRFSDAVSAFIETNYIFTGADKFDGVDKVEDNDRFLQHNIGLGFNLGKAKDTDADGVPDRRDKCPDTPTGVTVDKDGCPVDGDGDGVPDYQDECPAEAGVANLGGCPDKDGDGIADKNDQCPDQAGTTATQGCPDADADGVADAQDKCPDTPAGVQVGADGCPVDSDGDGVADNDDLCPNSAGPADKGGCPELDAKTLQLMKEKVRFEFDQARVQEGYKELLDSIVVALQKYPDHVLLIKGHADHIGSAEYNQALSERRAEAVKEYLLQRGIQNPKRLVTKGYGETQPLVKVNTRQSKSKTATARARNRRVGFELNTPDLKLNLE